MNRMQKRRLAREQKLSKTLMAVFVAVLLAGVLAQIGMMARLSGQNKAMDALSREMRQLSASAENLNLSLNQFHNLNRIAARAQQLGMQQPSQTQIRVVSLPGTAQGTSTQSVDNLSAEEILH